jgi:steroid delta-isomerase-like uncharacterized protein
MAMFLVAAVYVGALAQTEAEMRAAWEGYVAAHNTHDLEALSTFWADDVVWDNVASEAPWGKAELQGIGQALHYAFPDFHVTSTRVLASGTTLAAEATLSGTFQEEFSGIPATGKSWQMPFLFLLDFEGDKMKHCIEYLDYVSFLVELGVSPPSDPLVLEPSFELPDPEATGLSPVDAAEELFSRFNSHDPVNYAKILQADVEGLIAPLGIPLDRSSLVAAVELYFLAFPDIRGEIVRSVDMGEGWVVLETVFSGTNDGPFFGIPATGRSAAVKCGFVVQSDADGLLTQVRDYYDSFSLLVQLGLAEPPSSVSTASWGQIKAKFQQ